MVKRFPALLFGATLLAVTPVSAQDAPPPRAEKTIRAALAAITKADPALWVVRDKDTTIYLFGTVHILKPGMSWFDDAVKKAFDKSDGLVLETVLPDPATMQAKVMQLALNPTGPTLTEKLPADDRAAYVKALSDLGLPAAAFDRVDPWVAATALSVMPVQKLGYSADNGPEKVLTDAAKQAGKSVTGLETVDQQLGYLDGLTEAAQLQFLEGAVKDVPKATQEFNTMVADWAAGKPEDLAKIVNDDLTDTPELKKTLITDRNARWATWIANRLKAPGTIFIAVGAGHLAGKGSVQDDLAAMHIKAKRIRY